VHSLPQLRLDFLKLRPHAVTPGLPLKLEGSPSRFAADEGEAQESEGLRSTDAAFLAVDCRVAAAVGWGIVISIAILVALAALSGLVLGRSGCSLLALLVAGAVLAPVTAFALQHQGSSAALPGILVIVACLAINQAAYVIGGISRSSGPRDPPEQGSPHIQADDVPGDGRQDDVPHEGERQQKAQSNVVHLSEKRHADPTR
jgi:hypothetical protein